MPLDPRAKAIADRLGTGLDLRALDLAVVRAATDMGVRQGPRQEVAHCEDRRIAVRDGAITLRIYTPEARAPLPGLVYLHGGCWAMCGLETHDALCRRLANGAGCMVVSVDYRLAPEHPYPAPAEDAYAATRWVADHAAELGVDSARLAVAGDSAGGNLAAVVALMARDRGGPDLCHQLLIYPITDCSFETDSYRENAEGPLLTRDMMEVAWEWYLGDTGRGHEAYASPLRAENLAGLPPGFVLTAEFDPLRDEGEAYAARLRAAGVSVAQKRYDGMIHGFMAMEEELPAATEAVDDAVAELRAAFAR
jgi:acetyl esterase